MKKSLLISLLLLVTNITFSQELTSVIKGAVTDKESQASLIGVNIILIGSDPLIGTTTDINGEFRLENVPVGRQIIKVSFLGYETREIPNLLVLSAKELNVNVTLSEKYNELGEFESGVAARFLGPVGAVLLGGSVAIVVALLWTRLFPDLAKADTFEGVKEQAI